MKPAFASSHRDALERSKAKHTLARDQQLLGNDVHSLLKKNCDILSILRMPSQYVGEGGDANLDL
jgi:hypothetical protein